MSKLYIQPVINESTENVIKTGVIFVIAKNEKEARKELSGSYPEFYDKDNPILAISLNDKNVNAVITELED